MTIDSNSNSTHTSNSTTTTTRQQQQPQQPTHEWLQNGGLETQMRLESFGEFFFFFFSFY